jgi:uncharacterized protein YecT (DUF1311 family)
MKCHVKIIMATVVMSALLIRASDAQPVAPGLSPHEKAKLEEKQAQDKELDRAYKSTLNRIPDPQQTSDPWGNVRAPSKP